MSIHYLPAGEPPVVIDYRNGFVLTELRLLDRYLDRLDEIDRQYPGRSYADAVQAVRDYIAEHPVILREQAQVTHEESIEAAWKERGYTSSVEVWQAEQR